MVKAEGETEKTTVRGVLLYKGKGVLKPIMEVVERGEVPEGWFRFRF